MVGEFAIEEQHTATRMATKEAAIWIVIFFANCP
jgi:hypothetical protein